MTSRRFQIGSATLSANDPHLAPTLADAHARRIRPLCLCRAPAAPMYVARVAGQFIPKRMPGTGGPQHDPGCESYEAPPELSGFGDVVGRAIQEDADAGVTVLKSLASPLATAEDALARLDERLGANLGASLLARSVARADDDGAHKQNKRRPFAIAPTSWM